jgi:hypothetical protein
MSLDIFPFLDHGVAGAFAFGALGNAPGDGERTSWTVLPPLGRIELRPEPEGQREAYPRRSTDKDRRACDRLSSAACDLYPLMLGMCLPGTGLMSRWQARVSEQQFGSPLYRARSAYYGTSWCPDRLDLPIYHAARDRELFAFISADAGFGSVLWDRDRFCPWGQAQRIGKFVASSVPVLGEPGWRALEKMMTLAMDCG